LQFPLIDLFIRVIQSKGKGAGHFQDIGTALGTGAAPATTAAAAGRKNLRLGLLVILEPAFADPELNHTIQGAALNSQFVAQIIQVDRTPGGFDFLQYLS